MQKHIVMLIFLIVAFIVLFWRKKCEAANDAEGSGEA